MDSGKFDEKLRRMSAIVDAIRPFSLVLFNESFAATNEREGSEIPRQFTRAVKEKEVKVVFVTHMYQFARRLHEKRDRNFMFLQPERNSDGTRTFQLLEGDPSSTSYGPDLYRRIFESSKKASRESDESREPAFKATDYSDEGPMLTYFRPNCWETFRRM